MSVVAEDMSYAPAGQDLGYGDQGLGYNQDLGYGDNGGLGYGGRDSRGGYGNGEDLGYGNTSDLGYGDANDLGYAPSQELGYGNTQDLGYGNTQDLGYGNTKDLGYGNTQDLGYGDTQDLGYGNTQDLGYGNTQDTDLGYGEAQPAEEPPKNQGQGRRPRRRCSVTKYSLEAQAQAQKDMENNESIQKEYDVTPCDVAEDIANRSRAYSREMNSGEYADTGGYSTEFNATNDSSQFTTSNAIPSSHYVNEFHEFAARQASLEHDYNSSGEFQSSSLYAPPQLRKSQSDDYGVPNRKHLPSRTTSACSEISTTSECSTNDGTKGKRRSRKGFFNRRRRTKSES